jgi:hypothetical protein
MLDHEHLPEADKLSIVAAMVLLAYAASSFIEAPVNEVNVQLPGFLLAFSIRFTTLISFLAAALAGMGSIWIIQDHPHLEGRKVTENWFLPALTAWGLGVPLSNIAVSRGWWVIFGLGGLLLILVLIAEYIAVDPADSRHVPATVGLTAVAFALFVVLAVALRMGGARLFIMLPVIVPAAFLVILRILNLRLGGRWRWEWSLVGALAIGQFALAFHYLPLPPLSFGLMLAGPAYALASLAASSEESRSWQTAWLEPAIMWVVLWVAAFLLR